MHEKDSQPLLKKLFAAQTNLNINADLPGKRARSPSGTIVRFSIMRAPIIFLRKTHGAITIAGDKPF